MRKECVFEKELQSDRMYDMIRAWETMVTYADLIQFCILLVAIVTW